MKSLPLRRQRRHRGPCLRECPGRCAHGQNPAGLLSNDAGRLRDHRALRWRDRVPADKLLTNTTPLEVAKALSSNYLRSPFDVSVNAFLVNTGSRLVLVDTDAGSLFGAVLGKLSGSLTAAGYLPEQVDEVYLTHMHADHVGELMAGDKLAFPNAVVRR